MHREGPLFFEQPLPCNSSARLDPIDLEGLTGVQGQPGPDCTTGVILVLGGDHRVTAPEGAVGAVEALARVGRVPVDDEGLVCVVHGLVIPQVRPACTIRSTLRS